MAKEYRPALSWMDDERLTVPSCTVVEPEPTTKWSGLYDAAGRKLMVVEKMDRVGFVWYGREN